MLWHSPAFCSCLVSLELCIFCAKPMMVYVCRPVVTCTNWWNLTSVQKAPVTFPAFETSEAKNAPLLNTVQNSKMQRHFKKNIFFVFTFSFPSCFVLSAIRWPYVLWESYAKCQTWWKFLFPPLGLFSVKKITVRTNLREVILGLVRLWGRHIDLFLFLFCCAFFT